MKNKNKIVTLVVSSVLVVSISGCARTVTGNEEADNALTAFNEIVKAYPENKGFHSALQHWGYKLPTGEKFEWSKDMSANKADFAMVMLADPLVEAGLDIDKLEKNEWLYEPAAKDEMGVELPNRLIKPYNVSDKKQTSSGSEDSMRRLLKQDTNGVEYNKEEQQFILALGEGNAVQWTETLGLNDQDMTFVLKAGPLIEAGLDIKLLEGSGWTFEKSGGNGEQIVKTYDIKQ